MRCISCSENRNREWRNLNAVAGVELALAVNGIVQFYVYMMQTTDALMKVRNHKTCREAVVIFGNCAINYDHPLFSQTAL